MNVTVTITGAPPKPARPRWWLRAAVALALVAGAASVWVRDEVTGVAISGRGDGTATLAVHSEEAVRTAFTVRIEAAGGFRRYLRVVLAPGGTSRQVVAVPAGEPVRAEIHRRVQ